MLEDNGEDVRVYAHFIAPLYSALNGVPRDICDSSIRIYSDIGWIEKTGEEILTPRDLVALCDSEPEDAMASKRRESCVKYRSRSGPRLGSVVLYTLELKRLHARNVLEDLVSVRRGEAGIYARTFEIKEDQE